MKPAWEVIHDDWMSELRHWLNMVDFFEELVRRNVHQPSYTDAKESLRLTKKKFENIMNEYKKIYGSKPTIRRLRNE